MRYTVADYHSAAKKVGLAEFASAGGTGSSTGGGLHLVGTGPAKAEAVTP